MGISITGSDFNELTFSNCINYEIQERFNPTQQPYFPTRVEEAKLGYDTKHYLGYGIILYLQFKVPEYMEGGRAREHVQEGEDLPFYRIRLNRGTGVPQFNILHGLSRFTTQARNAYICSPSFHTVEKLSHYYAENGVSHNSEFIDPSQHSVLDDSEDHSIVYRGNGTERIYSEKKKAETSSISDILGGLYEDTEEIDEEYLKNIYRSMKKNVSEFFQEKEEAIELLGELEESKKFTTVDKISVLSSYIETNPYFLYYDE